MSIKQQARKDKIALLKGVLEGTRSLKEFIPKETYLVMSFPDCHHVRHFTKPEVTVMTNDEYAVWLANYKSTWIKGSKHFYLTTVE